MKRKSFLIIIFISVMLTACGVYKEEDKEGNLSVSESGYNSVSELAKEKDPAYNDSDKYIAALKGYDEAAKEIIDRGKEKYGESTVAKFSIVYIDDDDIPELFASYGSEHMKGILIYKYSIEDGLVKYLGEFSIYGRIGYNPYNNCIISNYGNNGYFVSYYSRISGDSVELEDSILMDGGINSEDYDYYHGYAIPSEVNGSIESFDKADMDPEVISVDESMILTENEYEELEKSITGNPEDLVYLSYNDMDEIITNN